MGTLDPDFADPRTEGDAVVTIGLLAERSASAPGPGTSTAANRDCTRSTTPAPQEPRAPLRVTDPRQCPADPDVRRRPCS